MNDTATFEVYEAGTQNLVGYEKLRKGRGGDSTDWFKSTDGVVWTPGVFEFGEPRLRRSQLPE